MIGSRLRGRRSGAILAATLLIVAAVPGLVTAANTRFLWVGAPDLTVDTTPHDLIPDTNGILSPTKVSVPGTGNGPNATRFLVEIYNSGGQNLANTVLTINADAKALAGLALNTFYDPNGGDDDTFCDKNGDTITCDFGSLRSLGTRTVAVVVNVDDTFTATNTSGLFTASVTTNNENGSNFQTFPASSGTAFKVTAFGDDSLYTFELEGASKHLFTTGVGNAGGNLSTDVKFDASNKELVTINEAASTASLYPCPSGLTCQPTYSEVTTTSGSFGSDPFFTWKLTAIVPKTYSLSQGFVAHFLETDKTVPDWTLFFKNKSALCGLDIPTKIAAVGHCISFLSLTKYDKTSNLLEVTLVMDHQGGAKY